MNARGDHPVAADAAEGGTGENDDAFSSDIIDLSSVDLAAVRGLPNAVLRAAVERVCAELDGDAETTAFFQNVTPPPPDRRARRGNRTGGPQE